MAPYYDQDGITIYHGDSLDVVPMLEPESISAVITDPPYGLGFMGKAWDHAVPGVPFWQAFMGAMKPGAHLAAFGGSRTYHRMGVAIEDAGLELRDTLMWLYGSGFPKSHDVSKAIDKARKEDVEPTRVVCRAIRASMDARGLKSRDMTHHFGDCHSRLIDHWAARDTDSQPSLPTWDQWLQLKDLLGMGDDLDAEVWRLNGRKGTPGENFKRREVIGQSRGTSKVGGADDSSPWSVGAVQAGVDVPITAPATPQAQEWAGWGTALKPAHEPIILARKGLAGTVAANVLAHGTGALNIDASRIGHGDDVDLTEVQRQNADTAGMNGIGKSGFKPDHQQSKYNTSGRWPANVILDEDAAAALDRQSGERKSGWKDTDAAKRSIWNRENEHTSAHYGDTGGASRFFYCAKASRAERNAGLDGMPERQQDASRNAEQSSMNGGEGNPYNRGVQARTNYHPTVKPLALMRYLITLVTPPGGIVLDPFAGSGTTGVVCAELGIPCVLIEKSEDYLPIIVARIRYAQEQRAQLANQYPLGV